MSDLLGLSDGVKGLSSGLDSARDAGKSVSKQIENIQKDATDVAKERAQERVRAAREAELKKERALIKALNEWKRKKQISDEEADLKIKFVKQYGTKEWDALLRIKLDIENMERKNNEEFQHDLKAVRRVQFYCFVAALVVTLWLKFILRSFLMFTLLTTLVSFLAGGLPKLMDYFQDKSDKAHELQLAQMQTERELKMLKEGYIAQARVEEIRTEQIAIQSAEKEREALYAHDIAIGQGAAQWVINARAFTRSFITYGLFILFAFVEIFGFYYAVKTGVDFSIALDVLWDNETQIVWASVVSFWFGTQAFKSK